ncbi:acyltransferase [Pseudoalteromonas sp. JB197]|uniref:acyltransferase n=1 Tax=Pseudoalteromonas sp. JB197 TaxID=1434839 RepID=UPI00097EC04B|nr:galactoside O-acetyltransferase [Pseudoalteromonas sp. JB197]PCC11827.1 galactoside O-acetyltransferase [Pseudoalteromonas sp. JB197]SJN46474.1 O-acetyltransferase, putative [Pseudoalteromonas sp. JB197]
MAILSAQQLKNIGFKSVGENVRISDKASIYGAANISIGSNVRIDDFVVLSAGDAGIEIGNYIHIAVFSLLIGAGKITLSDFCNVSSRVSIYSSSDDYSGEFMTNPMVPQELTSVVKAPVFLFEHVIVGSGSVILPGVTLAEGVAVGSLSLVSKSFSSFEIIAGVPAKKIKDRKKNILQLAKKLLIDNK